MKKVIDMAREGRPDLAAFNAASEGRLRLAVYVLKKYPHLPSGMMLPVREWIYEARRVARAHR